MMRSHTDVLVVGSGVAGLYCALNLPASKQVTVITKAKAEQSDSFLAQGGICVLRDEGDYEAFFEDTMRAGHRCNDPRSVEIMIRSSRRVITDLVARGVRFERDGDGLAYTREGAHSAPRILYHQDETGKEITSCLLEAVSRKPNIRLVEDFAMVDLLCSGNVCHGVVGFGEGLGEWAVEADYTVLATGGVGGLFERSTNYAHLTGDAIALGMRHGVKMRDLDYVQIHPTTLYTPEQGRAFLISESVRGEGGVLLGANGERFVDELLPRDAVTAAIRAQMELEGTPHVWLSLAAIPRDDIMGHFPHIYRHCLERGYDVTREPIPVVPAQHYFMGGIAVDHCGATSMERLYAAGETACNGVHGKNRLASNSLLESLVFAQRAAWSIARGYSSAGTRQAVSAHAPALDAASLEAIREAVGARSSSR